jgi:hypothetical protein
LSHTHTCAIKVFSDFPEFIFLTNKIVSIHKL